MVKIKRSKYGYLSRLVLFYGLIYYKIVLFRRKLEKKQEGDDVPKKIPHTLESLREKDETMLANVDEAEQEEVRT